MPILHAVIFSKFTFKLTNLINLLSYIFLYESYLFYNKINRLKKIKIFSSMQTDLCFYL